MMAKFRKLFILAMLVLVCSITLFAGCSRGGTPDVPANLKMNSSGVLAWTAVEGVDYEVSLDGVDYFSVEKNSVDLLSVVESTETNKIYVRGKSGKNTSESAIYELSVVQLAAPSKAEISVDSTTHEEMFVWNEVEKANKYYISING